MRMLRSGRRDVEVPARVAAAVGRFAHLVSAKYVFVTCRKTWIIQV